MFKRIAESIGTLALATSIIALAVLMLAELQYWVDEYMLVAHKSENFVNELLMLDIVHQHGSSVTLAAVISSMVACILLVGKLRLLALAGAWLLVGASASGHIFYTYISVHTWGWIALAACAIFSVFLPVLASPLRPRERRYTYAHPAR